MTTEQVRTYIGATYLTPPEKVAAQSALHLGADPDQIYLEVCELAKARRKFEGAQNYFALRLGHLAHPLRKTITVPVNSQGDMGLDFADQK